MVSINYKNIHTHTHAPALIYVYSCTDAYSLSINRQVDQWCVDWFVQLCIHVFIHFIFFQDSIPSHPIAFIIHSFIQAFVLSFVITSSSFFHSNSFIRICIHPSINPPIHPAMHTCMHTCISCSGSLTWIRQGCHVNLCWYAILALRRQFRAWSFNGSCHLFEVDVHSTSTAIGSS